MSKDQVMEHDEFQKFWLAHANAHSVFECLRAPHFSQKEDIQKVLITEPLINLGLALYARRQMRLH